MNELVIMQDRQAVTSSTNIASDFGKQHGHVLRDIRNLQKDVSNFGEMFSEVMEPDSYGRNQTIVYMNRDGFTLLAMGFTGSKALEFKLKYIGAFNEMEKSLNAPRPLTEREQLKASMRLSLETSEDVEILKEDVAVLKDKVENQITLDHGEQRGLQKAVSRKVYELEQHPQLRPKLFSELYREIKDRFGVASYKDVKRKDLTAAIGYVNAWIPKRVA